MTNSIVNRVGVVIRDEGNHLLVDLPGEAEPLPCVLRKTLRRTTGKKRKAVVVGDRVEVETSGEGAAIVRVEKRRTTLSRPDPFRSHREHILVANIDAALVVVSVRDPHLTPGVIDRFMVAVESRGLEPGLVINKTDLDPDGDWQAIANVYRALDYPVFAVSADKGIGIEEVREYLRERTTCLLGHSGVGKSSLANALDSSLALRVGEISASSGKGRHTTTAVSLLPLPWGGYLVDTPGIREFGLWKMKLEDLAVWFREFAPHIDACRFNDCLHRAEPRCAVKAALDRGEIVGWRYDSYLRILESLESPD